MPSRFAYKTSVALCWRWVSFSLACSICIFFPPIFFFLFQKKNDVSREHLKNTENIIHTYNPPVFEYSNRCKPFSFSKYKLHCRMMKRKHFLTYTQDFRTHIMTPFPNCAWWFIFVRRFIEFFFLVYKF